MSSALEHFSHPHILELKENGIARVDATCYGCEKSVTGSLAYTCTSPGDPDCENFYLHKSCAELPRQINHHTHNKHLLTLLPRHHCYCDVCGHEWKLFTYVCDDCQFYVCVICAFEQRELRHEGHQEHALTLMQKTALFACDACAMTAEDASYICTTCEFWIHRECALSPSVIPAPTYHHHPLNLIFSVPDIHRYFQRYCAICDKAVHVNYWAYYCHKCTYFVHVRCSTSSKMVPIVNENEADDTDNELDLVQFPLRSEESLFHLIMTQCSKLQIDFQGKGGNDIVTSTIPNDQPIIEEHWSHRNHPLQLFRFTISDNDNEEDEEDDDTRVLICDGCIQPITISHPNYYACIQCGYFLHSFCATKLPHELPTGASAFHPQHSLSLGKRSLFYTFSKCEACGYFTNGFYYDCETCDIVIDIRCVFLPARIKYKSHKHHYLVQRPFSGSQCSASKIWFNSGGEYACETCSDFKIHVVCAFYPSRLKYKYDLDHPITLRTPPFFYEGVFYCEICEEQVNNQWWLYHCGGCDLSFHYNCLHWRQNVKLGGTIKLFLGNQPHTFALVIKWPAKFNSPRYFCESCRHGYKSTIFFECVGCGILVCWDCARKITCEMSSLMEHFSHPEHSLILKHTDVIGDDVVCYGCNKSVIGFLTYTCTSHDSIDCRNFYLHKSCAELPMQITHHKHNQHPLALLPRQHCTCDVCCHESKLFTYVCNDCRFFVCLDCAFVQRELSHEGHDEHKLILMRRETLFKCDACGIIDKDSPYVCTICQFWIHKKCAFSPSIIPAPSYHHHPLTLIYSIPKIHRYFDRYCAICGKLVYRNGWLYYCHKCTYFVHMRRATSTNAVSTLDETEADCIDNEPDLLQFPPLSQESFLDIIMTQCDKLHLDSEGESDSSIGISKIPDDLPIIEEHWSHKTNPLIKFHFSVSENDDDDIDDDDSDDDRRVLICDGCIQPITISHPSYYACIQCGFFLHSFCATKLPGKLPVGASSFHPQHLLVLGQMTKFHDFRRCGVCCYGTSGFYYYCMTCDINIDLRCAFLPTRIKHKNHKHHSLVPRFFSKSICSLSRFQITDQLAYACESCSSFQISMNCLFYPSRMEHKYDRHPVTLRNPPFFYEGVFYCEICEEQVNNQWWLYHCDECDHSFHHDCLQIHESIKLGGTIELSINNQSHTFEMSFKKMLRRTSPLYICCNCQVSYKSDIFFECVGCGSLLCRRCVLIVIRNY